MEDEGRRKKTLATPGLGDRSVESAVAAKMFIGWMDLYSAQIGRDFMDFLWIVDNPAAWDVP